MIPLIPRASSLPAFELQCPILKTRAATVGVTWISMTFWDPRIEWFHSEHANRFAVVAPVPVHMQLGGIIPRDTHMLFRGVALAPIGCSSLTGEENRLYQMHIHLSA